MPKSRKIGSFLVRTLPITESNSRRGFVVEAKDTADLCNLLAIAPRQAARLKGTLVIGTGTSPKLIEAIPRILELLLGPKRSEIRDFLSEPERYFPLNIILEPVAMLPAPPGVVGKNNIKGWYNYESRTITIAKLSRNPVKTLAHEMSHWIDTVDYEDEVNQLVEKYESRARESTERIMGLLKRKVE